MSIREIVGDGIPVDPIKPKKTRTSENAASAPRDKVEVSGEAKSLYEADQVKRFEEIRQKLQSGYYNSREVTEKVVDALMTDLKRSFSK